MGFFTRLMGREERSEPQPGMQSVHIGASIAGINVTADESLTLSAVWSAVQILSDALVGLPFHVRDSSDVKLTDHPVANLLRNDGEANDHMSAVAAKGALMANLALHGNGYAVIERDATGTAVGLYPILSQCTLPKRRNGQLHYVTMQSGQCYTLRAQDVLHILGPLTMDGITALSPVHYARQTVGLSLAMDRFAAKFFGQGGNIGGIVEVPAMKEEALKNFIDKWRETYTGPESAFKIAALTGGMKFHRTTAEPDESQALESRANQVREIARIWRIPPHMLGDMSKASYASIEMQNMEFYQGTIHPYVVRMEAEIGRKLLLEREKRSGMSVRFNMDGKLRGTTQQRYAAYQQGRQGGWLSINDIRRMEDMPTIDGGDGLLEPLNMKPVGSGGGAAAKPDTKEGKDNGDGN